MTPVLGCPQAAKYLHDDRAKYPKKITFYNNAPHLALESVEVGTHVENEMVHEVNADVSHHRTI